MSVQIDLPLAKLDCLMRDTAAHLTHDELYALYTALDDVATARFEDLLQAGRGRLDTECPQRQRWLVAITARDAAYDIFRAYYDDHTELTK